MSFQRRFHVCLPANCISSARVCFVVCVRLQIINLHMHQHVKKQQKPTICLSTSSDEGIEIIRVVTTPVPVPFVSNALLAQHEAAVPNPTSVVIGLELGLFCGNFLKEAVGAEAHTAQNGVTFRLAPRTPCLWRQSSARGTPLFRRACLHQSDSAGCSGLLHVRGRRMI